MWYAVITPAAWNACVQQLNTPQLKTKLLNFHIRLISIKITGNTLLWRSLLLTISNVAATCQQTLIRVLVDCLLTLYCDGLPTDTYWL